MNKIITAEELRDTLNYDPETGVFVWRVSKTNWVKVGAVAGGVRTDGYIQIMIKRRQYTGHRLAWLYMTGKWPVGQIDHINGKRDDNRWENLREVSHSVNMQNQRRPSKNNTTGYLGVRRHQNGKGFVAVIELNGKSHYAGYSEDPKKAHEAYVKAKRRLHEGNTL